VYVGEGVRPVFVYRLTSTQYCLVEGRDGAILGDFKVITTATIPVDFLYQI
jgi:hypothetical protein